LKQRVLVAICGRRLGFTDGLDRGYV